MSNPFQELHTRLKAEAKKHPAAEPDASPKAMPGKPSRGPAPPMKSASTPASDDDDAALFLHSVTAAPLPKTTRGRSGATSGGVPMPSFTPPKPAVPPKAASAPKSAAPELPMPKRASPEPTAELPPDDSLFFTAMRGVDPIAAKGRDIHAPTEPQNLAAGPDPAAALRDLLDGKLEFALCHTEEYMEGFVSGLDPLILGKLRSGSLSPEAHLDLHGQNARQALDSLILFMKNAYTRGLRTVLVVTGRGRNSPDGIGILRLELQKWLTRDPFKRVVLAFCTAQTHDGGPGAVYVLLRKYKKNRGKIVWERGPGDDDGMI